MPKYTFADLCGVMDKLLGEGGCPWDRAQTHETLREFLIEECYEVIDAINRKDAPAMAEELGDVLLQVVFHGKLAEAEKIFTIDDITDGITRKMISRHRHIFGDDVAETPEEVLDNWEKIKKEEKGYATATETLRAIPNVLPALTRAQKVQKKAAKYFDMNGGADAYSSLTELAEELKKISNISQNSDEVLRKYGEFLFAAVNIAQTLKINPEFALTNAIETFINRFENIENVSLSKNGSASQNNF